MAALGESCFSDHRNPDKETMEKMQQVSWLDKFQQTKNVIKKKEKGKKK